MGLEILAKARLTIINNEPQVVPAESQPAAIAA